jgi:hypothetical protein
VCSTRTRFRQPLDLSRESAQIFAEGVPVGLWRELLDGVMRFLPDRKSTGEKSASLFSEDEDAATTVIGIALDFEKAAALEWLQSSSEGSAIHRKQGSDRSHRWGLRTVEGHEQRELTIGEFEWAKFFVETAGESARCTLHVKAKTAVFYHQRCFERQVFST